MLDKQSPWMDIKNAILNSLEQKTYFTVQILRIDDFNSFDFVFVQLKE